MKIFLDTSVVLAVLINESQRQSILNKIEGNDIICAESIVFEIGNAISSMFKRKKINLEQGKLILKGFYELPIQIIEIDFERAINIASEFGIYAYDAYVLDCCERMRIQLATLDNEMKRVSRIMKVNVLEV